MAKPPESQVVPRRQRATVTALIILATLAVCAAAKVAAPFLIPVVVGTLASYSLKPLVNGLERIHVPRAIGSAIVLLVIAAIIGGGIFLLRDDATSALAALPEAAHKIRIAARASSEEPTGPVGHVRAAAAELNRAAAEATGAPAPPTASPAPPAAPSAIQQWVSEESAKFLEVLVEIGVAGLLAYFLLAAGDAFRRKLAHLAGPTLAARRITVEILDEIDAQVQRYLVTMLVLNTLIGISTWAILLGFGVEHAVLWGVFAAVVHIIPYVGSAVTIVATGVATFVQYEDIARAVIVAGLVGIAATLIGMGLSAWMLGRAFRMNAVAVFVALIFFGWLWGGWGLLVGVPLLAVVKTTAERIPGLERIAVLLAENQRTTTAAAATTAGAKT
ncbi:MAG TPA: AI-2E family transporter [Casimicrobiaceae bacterium]|nr:AI-2E family transporter [Casimicrobiaceae bacterium]